MKNAVYLQPCYATLLVGWKIPATQAWLELIGAIDNDGSTNKCRDQLTWLQATLGLDTIDPKSCIPIIATEMLQYVMPLLGQLAIFATRKKAT